MRLTDEDIRYGPLTSLGEQVILNKSSLVAHQIQFKDFRLESFVGYVRNGLFGLLRVCITIYQYCKIGGRKNDRQGQ